MRKLRRLPWRIPKSHNQQPQQSASTPAETPHRMEAPRETMREAVDTQPVAFAGGRYVYGEKPSSVSCSTEIRRKARHRVIAVPGLTPQQA
jgi:hypothetical protein